MFGVEVLHLAARHVTPFALALGISIQFVGNKLFAFRDRSPAWLRQAMLFLAVEAAGYAANLALFDFFSMRSRVPYPILRLVIGSFVYFGICLPLWTRIFGKPESRGATIPSVRS